MKFKYFRRTCKRKTSQSSSDDVDNSSGEHTAISVPQRPTENVSDDLLFVDDNGVLSSRQLNTTTNQKKRKLSRLSQFIDSLSPKEQQDIDTLSCRLFYACQIPLKIVESRHFIDFIKALRPSYQLPKLKSLSTDMLNDLHRRYGKRISPSAGSEGVLIIKRLKEQSMYQVIVFVQMMDKSPVYSTTKKVSRNDFYWSDVFIDSKKLAKEKSIEVFAAIINDSITLIDDTTDFEEIWLLQCNWSFGKLMEEKLLSLDIIDKAQCLLDAFSSPELSRKLVENGGIKADTTKAAVCPNWHLISTCLENLDAMSRMLGDRTLRLDAEVVALLRDELLEEKLKYHSNLLKPIVSIVEKSQKQQTTLADIIEDWLK